LDWKTISQPISHIHVSEIGDENVDQPLSGLAVAVQGKLLRNVKHVDVKEKSYMFIADIELKKKALNTLFPDAEVTIKLSEYRK